LTGETGAGKSIIVDALALLRGARGRAEIVRQGADAARASAEFERDAATLRRVAPGQAGLGVLGEDAGSAGPLRRGRGLVVGRRGRGRSVLQAVLTTQGMLERVGEQLIDICRQHEHHSLTHVARHIDLLDAYAGLEAEAEAYAQRYREWQAAAQAAAD